MEELIGKLVKAEDCIRSSTIVKSAQAIHDDYEACRDVLNGLIDDIQRTRMRQWSDHQLVMQKKLEKVTQSLMKTLRVQKRERIRNTDYNTGSDCVVPEDSLLKLAQDVVDALTTEITADEQPADACAIVATTSGLPSSVQEYKHRLEKYSKELYKNPPAMPPDHVVVVIETNSNTLPHPPQRDSKTKRLTFFMPFEEYQSKKKSAATTTDTVVTDFHPNVTPDEVLFEGAFGGTYFRNIHSAVTNTHYIGTDVIHETLAPEWLSKYDAKSISTKLTSSTYRTAVNKFKVKCGGSLGMWEVRVELCRLVVFPFFETVASHKSLFLPYTHTPVVRMD